MISAVVPNLFNPTEAVVGTTVNKLKATNCSLPTTNSSTSPDVFVCVCVCVLTCGVWVGEREKERFYRSSGCSGLLFDPVAH